jgi:hypothetical protein
MDSIISVEQIERKIYFIRGYKVMLDRELAGLYGVETRVLNQAVRRNIKRFPGDFMFSLSREEIKRISQFVTSSIHHKNDTLKFSKKVMVFTEQGVAMLSSVLNSERAVQVNIAIMRAFVKLREIVSTHKELAGKLAELESKVAQHDECIQDIFQAIRQLMMPPETKKKRSVFRSEKA